MSVGTVDLDSFVETFPGEKGASLDWGYVNKIFSLPGNIELVSLCKSCQRLHRKHRHLILLARLFGNDEFYTTVPGCITTWDEEEI
jgi:hypothetical protein